MVPAPLSAKSEDELDTSTRTTLSTLSSSGRSRSMRDSMRDMRPGRPGFTRRLSGKLSSSKNKFTRSLSGRLSSRNSSNNLKAQDEVTEVVEVVETTKNDSVKTIETDETTQKLEEFHSSKKVANDGSNENSDNRAAKEELTEEEAGNNMPGLVEEAQDVEKTEVSKNETHNETNNNTIEEESNEFNSSPSDMADVKEMENEKRLESEGQLSIHEVANDSPKIEGQEDQEVTTYEKTPETTHDNISTHSNTPKEERESETQSTDNVTYNETDNKHENDVGETHKEIHQENDDGEDTTMEPSEEINNQNAHNVTYNEEENDRLNTDMETYKVTCQETVNDTDCESYHEDSWKTYNHHEPQKQLERSTTAETSDSLESNESAFAPEDIADVEFASKDSDEDTIESSNLKIDAAYEAQNIARCSTVTENEGEAIICVESQVDQVRQVEQVEQMETHLSNDLNAVDNCNSDGFAEETKSNTNDSNPSDLNMILFIFVLLFLLSTTLRAAVPVFREIEMPMH